MCNKNWIIVGIIHLNAMFVTALILCITAAAANASVFGALAAVPIMISASVVVGGALASLAAYYAGLRSYYECMLRAANLSHGGPCAEPYAAARGTLEAAMAFTTLLLATCISVSVVAWIPFTLAAAIVGITYSFTLITGFLIRTNVAIANLIRCLESQVSRRRSTMTAIKVLSCPLELAVCSDQELSEVPIGTNGIHITSLSFAINLKAQTPKTISKVTANVTDGFSKTVAIDSAQIFTPGNHSIGPKDGWIVRLDWQKLNTKGIKIDIQKNRWLVTMDVTYADGTKSVETVTSDVTN